MIGHYIPDYSPLWYICIHDIIYTFHMPLFMFASGFIYMATKKDIPYKIFLWKKIKRLLVPYFSVSAIVISIKLLTETHAYVQNPVTVYSYFKLFYEPEAGAFLWFVWALWWMFVLVPLFKSKKNRIALFGVTVILHYIPSFLPDFFCLRQFQNMMIFFMLGVVFCDWKEIFSFLSNISSWLIYCFFAVCELMYIAGVLEEIVTIILPFIGISAVMALSNRLEKWYRDGNGMLMVVASSSYIIYLFHTTFEGFAKAVINKIPCFTDGTNYALFIFNILIVVICGVVCPILLHRYVLDKTHITKVLFGLK